jgi:transcriptional regulator with XRE-family HTH domain
MAAHHTMTKTEFKRALKALGLSVVGSRHALGVSKRATQRYASGEQDIPPPVAKLLRLALRYKISADDLRKL